SLGVLAAFAAPAYSAEISAQLSSVAATIGEEVTLTVTVRDAKDIKPPIIPKVDSMTISVAGLPSRSSGMSIINGQMTQWNEYSYQFSIVPKKTGRLTIPKIKVIADGQEFQTGPLTLVVSRAHGGKNLIVEVECDRKEAFVEQSVHATLRVW